MSKTESVIDYALLAPEHFDGVVRLGNQVHGDNYLSHQSLHQMYEKSFHDAVNASWVAIANQQVVGFRLTYAHSQWEPDEWCTPAAWPVPADKVCYFKCNTVAPDRQGLGIGSEMLQRAIASAHTQGAQAGLAHIWLASPGNSAYKYFKKNGGELIQKHPDKWRHEALYDGYDCPVCEGLCQCEAAEMLLRFS
ncbi:GNAT family N-acetyltransferase [Salinimonas chungwhensis]|uniref:GNAT family N-acetyltransferase n=1 Tax=Salinimonas chungwhensis TaxID=265425 RepID=UPI0003629731|nr:GNAT family N-acetyltransferase [Salinimonas chungwhensis]